MKDLQLAVTKLSTKESLYGGKLLETKLLLALHYKTSLTFNQGDTLAKHADCNVWEGKCARGDDSSLQR